MFFLSTFGRSRVSLRPLHPETSSCVQGKLTLENDCVFSLHFLAITGEDVGNLRELRSYFTGKE